MRAEPRLSRLGDLTLDQDLDFQQRSWRAQRAGQIVVGLILVGCILGFFGQGGLFAERELSVGVLHVRHPRFLRLQSPAEIVVTLDRADAPAGGGARTVDLWLDDAFANLFEFSDIVPEPISQGSRDGGTLYRFMIDNDTPATVRLRVTPRHWGMHHSRMGLADEPALELAQFVYP